MHAFGIREIAQHRLLRVLTWAMCMAMMIAPSAADDVTLNNGTVLSGKTKNVPGISQAAIQKNIGGNVPVAPLMQIENNIKRYFVPVRQVRSRDDATPPAPYTTFAIPQAGRTGSKMIEKVAVYETSVPFSDFGRRNIEIPAEPKPVVVTQAITSISPQEVVISALNFEWTYAVATSSLPLEDVLAIIRKKIVRSDFVQRLTLVSFLLEMGRHDLALGELDVLADEQAFADRAAQIADFRSRTRQLLAQKLLNEIQLRKAAGQHRLAFASIHKFPNVDINAANSRQVQELKNDYEQGVDSVDQIDTELRLLVSKFGSHPESATLQAMEWEILNRLGFDEIDRLRPFLRAVLTPDTGDEGRLALAISGWTAGSAYATESLTTAINMAKARHLILDYLRNDNPNTLNVILSDLIRLEGIGPETIGQLVPLMPLEQPAPPAESPSVLAYVTPDGTGYRVQPPLEYRPERAYPLLIVLNDPSAQIDTELRFWAGRPHAPGLAMERGYLTMSVDYLQPGELLENSPGQYHPRLLSAFRDAKKRFNIDVDRVIIAGHTSGGTAAIDMALSHPDLFAACVAFTAPLPAIIQDYRDNEPLVPMYLVNGSIDSLTSTPDLFHIDRMMMRGGDIIFAEFINRGHEFYFEELPVVFDWIAKHRRIPVPKEFTVQMARPTENQFFWVRLANMPLTPSKSLQTTGRVSPNQDVISIRTGAQKVEVLLGDELVDFNKFVRVSVGRRDLPRQIPERNVETMLQELKLSGDRKRLTWMRLAI